MKKVLLAGTALVAAALVASPAQAELKLGLGGHFKGYGVYVDEDVEAAGERSFEFRRQTEIHFTGETTLDNGLTVGVHVEQDIEDTTTDNSEAYAYFSGGWGRVNFGNEDGAAYLLQVAAPSADSNIDGLRTSIKGFETDSIDMDYDLAHFGNGVIGSDEEARTDRLTYLTPKFNGFQAGVSYAPNNDVAPAMQAMGTLGYEDLWEVAARWDGQFEGVGLSVGAGYTHATNENGVGKEDAEGWNVGFNLAWNAFSFGAVYLDEEGLNDLRGGQNGDETTTWVVGAAWDNGPWHVGASYLAREDETAGTDIDSYKTTLGGGYTFGPGMTFRGALAFGEAALAGNEESFTQVTLGTDISF